MSATQKFPFDINTETMRICDAFLKLSFGPSQPTKADCMQRLETLCILKSQLERIQAPYRCISPITQAQRVRNVEALLREYALDARVGVDVTQHNSGLGLATKCDFQADDAILEIPIDFAASSNNINKKAATSPPLISSLAADASDISEFLRSCQLTNRMKNVKTAVFLLNEKIKSSSASSSSDSKFTTYLNSLPVERESSGNVIFDANLQHFKLIKESFYLEKFFSHLMAVCRQYAFIYSFIAHSKSNRKLIKNLRFRDRFCLEDYKWAVAMVMSRNDVMFNDPNELCLIPIWDMINHDVQHFNVHPIAVSSNENDNGDYEINNNNNNTNNNNNNNNNSAAIRLVALKPLCAQSPLFMCYASETGGLGVSRSTAQFFQYNAFVPHSHPRDEFELQLHFPFKDALIHRRIQLFNTAAADLHNNDDVGDVTNCQFSEQGMLTTRITLCIYDHQILSIVDDVIKEHEVVVKDEEENERIMLSKSLEMALKFSRIFQMNEDQLERCLHDKRVAQSLVTASSGEEIDNEESLALNKKAVMFLANRLRLIANNFEGCKTQTITQDCETLAKLEMEMLAQQQQENDEEENGANYERDVMINADAEKEKENQTDISKKENLKEKENLTENDKTATSIAFWKWRIYERRVLFLLAESAERLFQLSFPASVSSSTSPSSSSTNSATAC